VFTALELTADSGDHFEVKVGVFSTISDHDFEIEIMEIRSRFQTISLLKEYGKLSESF
jgi:hypothetical protein